MSRRWWLLLVLILLVRCGSATSPPAITPLPDAVLYQTGTTPALDAILDDLEATIGGVNTTRYAFLVPTDGDGYATMKYAQDYLGQQLAGAYGHRADEQTVTTTQHIVVTYRRQEPVAILSMTQIDPDRVFIGIVMR